MIKGAIIGLGKISRTAHVPAYTGEKVRKNIRITAGVDISDANRASFIELIPGINVYSTIEEMYAQEKVNFIDICVPPNMHERYIGFAMRNKINVLCEKPLTTGIESAVSLKNELLDSGIKFMPIHQYKYSPVWRIFKAEVKDIKNSNKIFLQFNVYRLAADSGYDSKNPSWRTDRGTSGGGILSDTGTHYLYLTDYLLGKPLEIASHNFRLRKNPYEIEDTSVTIISTDRGTAQINLTWAAAKRLNTAFMTDGNKNLFYDGTKIELYENGKSELFDVPDASDKKTYVEMYENMLIDFIEECKSETYKPDFILESFDVIKMLDCCYKSSRLKKTIRF